VVRTLGTSFPTDGPGLSARIRLMFEPPLSGTMASRNTRTPMPPIQCVKLLHKSEQCESPSTFARMLAPVVVKPDIVSNRASVKDGISPVTKKGRRPAYKTEQNPCERCAYTAFLEI